MNKKGFTLIESLVSLILASFLVLAIVQVSILVSDIYTATQEQESLDAAAISWIEQQRFNLNQAGVLNESREVLADSAGDVQYTLVGEITALDYNGAYELVVNIKSLNSSITHEVILYA